MDVVTQHLDGNAAAGLLAEIFAFDFTVARAICAGCGTEAPVGELAVYGLAMGAILRCPSCDTPLVRVARLGDSYGVDLRGASLLRITPHRA
jgi:NAD-dependent SIR2 family protein deacetylase